LPVSRKFVIEDKSGEILYMTDVKPGDTYTTTFIHSINKSPVDEVYRIQSDYSMMLKKSVFRAFGVGIPEKPECNETFTLYDDRIEIANINRVVKDHLVFVGTISDHTFSMNSDYFHLNTLIEPQKTVRFRVRKIPLYTLIRRDYIDQRERQN
jgi:hypothetical protein